MSNIWIQLVNRIPYTIGFAGYLPSSEKRIALYFFTSSGKIFVVRNNLYRRFHCRKSITQCIFSGAIICGIENMFPCFF